jgi:hypothetical protein
MEKALFTAVLTQDFLGYKKGAQIITHSPELPARGIIRDVTDSEWGHFIATSKPRVGEFVEVDFPDYIETMEKSVSKR